MSYFERLKQLTVDCKDDGTRFLKQDRIREIQSLLENSDYQLLYAGNLCLLYGKATSMDHYRVLISSHIDCVYTECFVTEDSDDCWKGTFDNSATNAAIIDLMLEGALDNSVLVTFTGDEEKNSTGAIEVLQLLEERNCPIERTIVLDVTNEGWQDEAAFSIENDRGFDIITGFQIVSLLQESNVPCVFVHEAEPDETWEYYSYQTNERPRIPCLSLCLPVLGDMHKDSGVQLRKSSIKPYKQILKQLANATF